MGSVQATSNFRRRRKENLIKVLGNKCCICGYDRTVDALEFHHLIPEEKEYGIAAQGTCHDIEKDLAEIKKCILVCANCHREVHKNLYTLEELKIFQNFNEEFALELKLDRDRKLGLIEKEKCFCSICNVEIGNNTKTGMCPTCEKKSRRTCERPTREELKNFIRTMPFTQIGKQFGVSDNAVRKWCIAEGLPHKATEIKTYSDEEWVLR